MTYLETDYVEACMDIECNCRVAEKKQSSHVHHGSALVNRDCACQLFIPR
jgi:hypothetical protein